MLHRMPNEIHPAEIPALSPPAVAPASMALFLDIDGTLLDFAARPDAVRADSALRSLLGRLHRELGGAVALVSGRSLAGIDGVLGLPRFAAAGLHGAEIRLADGHVEGTHADPSRLDRLRDAVLAVADTLPAGVLVEDKGAALALHWRNAPGAATLVRRLAEDLLREAGAGFELQPGHCVVEVKPAGADKGRALAGLMRTPPFAGRVPWMFGDDLTDERAFERTNALGGVSVIVGARRPTLARHALADPHAVRAWLARLIPPQEEEP